MTNDVSLHVLTCTFFDSNAGARAAELAREYQQRQQAAAQNRVRGQGGALGRDVGRHVALVYSTL